MTPDTHRPVGEQPPSGGVDRPQDGVVDRPQDGVVEVGDGVDLAVVSWGAPSEQPPLLLVHGWTGGRHDWEDVGAELADIAPARRVLAYDHRGHGDSTHTGDPASYTFEQLVADLDALLAEVAPEAEVPQIDLLGHSMGGVVVQWWALAHPERVRSLVLMDTAGEGSGSMPMRTLRRTAQLGREQGMGAVVDQAVTAFGADLDPAAADDLRADLGRGLGAIDPEAFLALAEQLQDHRSVLDELATLTCPTTVLVGEHDEPLRPAADALAAAIPGAHLVVVPGAGHSPQRENTAAWLAALADHLTSQERP
jgi:pimeloyl-ACP methyl ester carboxylesterase